MSADVERHLIDAIHRRRLGSVASELGDRDDRAAAAVETCRRIADAVDTERDRVVRLLAANDIAVPRAAPMPDAQRHAFDLVLDHDEARRAADLLVADGFRRHPVWERGAERSFWTTGDQ